MNNRISHFLRAVLLTTACAAATSSCSDPTGVNRLEERDQNTPASVEVVPATLVVREGDTASVRVIVRNEAGGQIQPGAPRYIINWKTTNLEITNTGGLTGTWFRVRGRNGGTSNIEFEVVPFASPGGGSGFSSVVQPLKAQARVKVVGVPTQLLVVGGDLQAAPPGATLPDSVTLRVLDKRGKPVAEERVSFRVASGGGQISATTVATDDDGVARVSWKLGSSTGEQSLETSAGTLAGPVITAVAQPSAAQIVVVTGSGQSAAAGAKLGTDLAVQVRDASGRGVAGVTVYWNVTAGGGSASPSPSLTDANGRAQTSWTLGGTSGTHTLVAKAPGVGEVTFSATATSGAPPGISRVVVSPEAATLDAINDQTKLSATVYDAANQPLTGQTVTWTSLSSGIATVDASGLITARAIGTALIVAMAGGASDTTTITVRQVPTSITLNTSSVVLAAGGTQQLAATVLDGGGTAIPGASVTWNSSAPTVASVNSTGLVSGVSSGTAVVTAASGSLSAMAAVSVTSGTPTSPGSGTIPLQIVGFTTGNVLVSSGIPLAPGMLMPGDLGRVRLLVGSQEQSIFIKALNGRHRDGSVRSVLVQFMYNVGSSPIMAELVIGSQRTKADRAESAVTYSYDRPLPAAVALPRSVDYLLTTGIVMPTLPMPASFNHTYEDNFVKQSDGRWNVFKAAYLGKSLSADAAIMHNYYDRSLFHWAWWVRTGDSKYWERAVYYLMAYRELYARRYDYNVQPHQIQVEGLELHYLLAGDTESLRGVGRVGEQMGNSAWMTSLNDMNIEWLEGRIQSRVLLGIMTAHRLGFTDRDYRAQAREALDRILSTQSSDGAYRFPGLCNQQLNYMTGLVNEVMAKYYELIDRDPRIPSSIGKALDYLWNNQWRSADGAFSYTSERSCSGVGGTDPAPDLNLLIVHGFGWMYKHTGNTTYRTRGDVIFNEGVKRAWLGSSTYTNADKQYNENYRSSYQYPYLRQ